MTWTIRYTNTFYKELALLPVKTRQQIEAIAFGEQIKNDPFSLRKIEKLEGYQEYYKMRFGAYRVGLRLDSKEKIIEFKRVLHRKEIYRKFP